jgi:hypothetical protein
MVISLGPGWVVIGATLVVVDVVVVDVIVVDVAVEVLGAIESSTPTRLDATETFKFCSLLHANKKLALSSGRRKFDFTYSITEYDTTCDETIRRRDLDPWPTSP